MNPGVVGLSRRSVTRYCSQNGIHYSSRLNDQELNDLVENSVFRVLYIILSDIRQYIRTSSFLIHVLGVLLGYAIIVIHCERVY